MIRRTLSQLLGLLAGTIIFGTLGYRFIEQWTWLDALYMTFITLSTVGFGEIRQLSPAGRIFTMVLIVAGASVVAYAVRNLIELLSSGELSDAFQRRRMIQIKDHCIVCGLGRVGQYVAAELVREGVPFVVIDRDDRAIALAERLGYPYVQGDATVAETFLKARIDTARFLIAAVDSDSENVFIVLTVREIREGIIIIARTNSDDTIPKLRKAGADRVISPYALAGHRIVGMVKRPAVTDFLEDALQAGDIELRIEEFDIQPESSLVDKTLGETDLRHVMGISVLAIGLPNEGVVAHPDASTTIRAGAKLIVMGSREQLQHLSRLAE